MAGYDSQGVRLGTLDHELTRLRAENEQLRRERDAQRTRQEERARVLEEALRAIKERIETAVGAGVIDPPSPSLMGTRAGHIQAAIFSVIETASAAIRNLKEPSDE